MAIESDIQNPNGRLAVYFHKKSKQNAFKSEQAGRPIFDDIIYIKKMVPGDNLNIIAMQGDQVIFNEVNEGEVWVEGVSGYCKGYELNLSPRQVVEHFKVITEKPLVWP